MDYVIGIDIGATTTTFGLVDTVGNISNEGMIETRADEDATRFIPRLNEETGKLFECCGRDKKILGIGVGAPNGNYLKGTVDNPANLRWADETPLAQIISDKFSVKTVLTNDANAAALGEMHFGVAKGMRDFIEITLGTGLGSGIVVDGRLVYGHSGFAGELGHVIVREDGRESPFGRRGALEAYVSVTGLRRTVSKLLADSLQHSELRNISYRELTGEIITEAAMHGDGIALEAFEYTGNILGRGLANAVNFTSPEAIILFGGLAKAKDLIYVPTLRHLDKNLLPAFKGTVKLLLSGLLERNAGVLGAAALIRDELKQ